MSAFFVELGTIDDAVAAFVEIERTPTDPDALGRALYHLNAEAIRQRYPTIVKRQPGEARSEYEDYISQAHAYRYSAPAKSGAQRAQSCACLLYQCSEGDLPETSTLYRRLAAVRDAMDRTYGCRGAWGRDRCAA